MDIKIIMKLFHGLSGISYRICSGLAFMCEMAKTSIENGITDTARAQQYKYQLEYAAAALAYYRYCLWSYSTDSEEVKIGEVTVKTSTREQTEAALILYNEALKNIAVVFDDGGLVFEGVSS